MAETYDAAAGNLRETIRRSPRALFAVLIVGTALFAGAIAAAMYTNDPEPGTPCRTSGIVPLELAGDAPSAAHIVGDWTCPARGQSAVEATAQAEKALKRDAFVFIPLYVLAIGYWCFYASWYAHSHRSRMSARLLTFGIVLAGVFDVIEDIALYGVVHGHHNRATLATAVAIPKFALFILALLRALQAFGGAWMRWLRYVMFGESDRPQFAGPLTPTEPPVAPSLDPNTPEDARRIRRRVDPHGDCWESGIGVCFSGGGIRSASYALGGLHTLQEGTLVDDATPVWKRARYVSTVSGGGYTGTAAQILAHQAEPTDPPPLGPESAEYAHLRAALRRYLWSEPVEGHRLQSTQEFVSGVLLFIGGVAINILLLEAVGYLAATPLGWAARNGFYPGKTTQGGDDRSWTAGQLWGWALLAALIIGWLLVRLRRRPGAWSIGAALVSILKVAGLVGYLALATRGDFGANWVTVSVLPVAVFATLIAGWWFVAGRVPRGLTSAFLNVTLYSFAGVLLWYWANNGFQRGFEVRMPPLLFTIIVAVFVFVVVFIAVAAALRVGLQSQVLQHPKVVWLGGGIAAVLAAAASVGAAFVVSDPLDSITISSGAFYLGALIVVGTIYLTVDQKRWSPHPLYKARLARTFAMTKDAQDDVTPLPYRSGTDLTRWGCKPSNGPELLIGAAVYDTVELRRGEVNAWPFVFSSNYVGGADVGWTRTVDFEAALGRLNLPDGTLLAAMSISGAAVSPAIGQINLGSANAVIAAANARLGVWLPGPRYVAQLKEGGFAAPTWLRIRRFSHLLHEIAGSYDLDNRFVYVTDGGQVDNLGVIELLARGCDPILCLDASGDLKPNKALNTNTFDEIRELARRRLGVRFSVVGADEPDGPAPSADEGKEPRIRFGAVTENLCTPAELDQAVWPVRPSVPVAVESVAAMDVWYPNRSTRGRFVFAKCVLTPDVPDEVRSYAIGNGRHRFPSDTTIDQWLDLEQFDAYVALGRHVAERALEVLDTAYDT